jgi:hypothetical protein
MNPEQQINESRAVLDICQIERQSDSERQREYIAKRAYFMYLAAGAKAGHDVDHWLRAETETLPRQSSKRWSYRASLHHKLPRHVNVFSGD